MRTLRVTMEAELFVHDDAENLGITAHVFAHHLKDSPVWQSFECLPSGDATPTDLTVTKIEELNDDGHGFDVWHRPEPEDDSDDESEDKDHEAPYRGEPDTV